MDLRLNAVSAQLCVPKNRYRGPPDSDLLKKRFRRYMLHHEAEWPSKQNSLIADTILAEPGP